MVRARLAQKHHTSRMKRNATRRQEEALERQNKYASLTAREKIARLDEKLGKGQGAKKERAKLSQAI